jgi:hypothetical protein
MRRLLWTALGVGFGAAAAVGVMRSIKRTREALRPASVAERAVETASDWRERLTVAFSVGREAAAERERQLRTEYGVDGRAR